jgi:hypothetical protein
MLSFLGNLGSGIARLGSGFAHGAASIGKGIGRGVRRLGELGDDEDKAGPFGTPPFMPSNNASRRGLRIVEDAVAEAENDAREDFGANPYSPRPTPLPRLASRDDLPDLPIKPGNITIPPLTPAPSSAELRSALPILPPVRSVTPVAPTSPPVAAGINALKPEMDLDRRNLPIPALSGHSGAPTPYNPIEAAKYDDVMKHAKRGAEGRLLSKAEGGGFNRDWKTSLQNAFLGAAAAASSARPGEDPLGRALGGALAAGAGSVINPQAGYEFNFDVGKRPKLEAELARSRAEEERERTGRMAAMDEELKRGQVEAIPRQSEMDRARIDQTRANIEISRGTTERQQKIAESQVSLNEARKKAIETGKWQKTTVYNPETDTIEEVWTNPNGAMQPIGPSGRAEMTRRQDAERMKRTQAQQAGASSRTAANQAGAKERAQMRIDAAGQGGQGSNQSRLRKPSGGKTATMGQLREFYKARGITDDAEIRKRAKDFGITVKD